MPGFTVALACLAASTLPPGVLRDEIQQVFCFKKGKKCPVLEYLIECQPKQAK